MGREIENGIAMEPFVSTDTFVPTFQFGTKKVPKNKHGRGKHPTMFVFRGFSQSSVSRYELLYRTYVLLSRSRF